MEIFGMEMESGKKPYEMVFITYRYCMFGIQEI